MYVNARRLSCGYQTGAMTPTVDAGAPQGPAEESDSANCQNGSAWPNSRCLGGASTQQMGHKSDRRQRERDWPASTSATPAGTQGE